MINFDEFDIEDNYIDTFTEVLDNMLIKYHYDNKWLVVDGNKDGYVWLNDTDVQIPKFVKFNNSKDIDLSHNNITHLSDVEFNNGGFVNLSRNNMTHISNVTFNNQSVGLSDNNLEYIPNSVVFNVITIYLHGNKLKKLPDSINMYFRKISFSKKSYIRVF